MVDITLKEVLGLVLAVIILTILISSCTMITGRFTTAKIEAQADATLTGLVNFLSDLNEGDIGTFVVYSPQTYWFIPYNAGPSSPSACMSQNCVCLCKEKDCPPSSDKNYCKVISKPLMIDKGKFQITVNSLIIQNIGASFSAKGTFSDVSDSEVSMESCSGDIANIGNGLQLRESAKTRLDEAKAIAKEKGKNLIVVSAYRSKEQQNQLWISKDKNPVLVCNPDSTKGICPHMTGCAVDVCFGELCNDNPANLNNADTQLLEQIMVQAGFVRYSAEYWHFEYGTTRWQTCKAANPPVYAC